MIKIFKHTFVPHEGNDYKPHFFREKSISIILAIAIFLLAVSFGSSIYIKNKNMIATVLPAVIVDLTNEARTKDGKLALAKSDLLTEAAMLKAEDMATYGYFAHTSPQGITPWHWFSKVGYYFVYAGENLAIDFNESKDVERAWLNSPTHKANILNNKFSEIGVATKQGYYKGHPSIYVVQMFGSPAFKSPENIDNKNILAINQDIEANDKNDNKKQISDVLNKVNSEKQKIETNPVVKGESIEAVQRLETISENEDFISVRNTEVQDIDSPTGNQNVTQYSNWKDRLIFFLPNYTNNFYQVIVWLILVALIFMLFIEIRKQHSKNIMYGILLIIIIFCFIYINRSIFITGILF